uniref:Methyltransferase type 11 domain-containing protein n=1 Tax=Panagrolaimus davidi TaxID=227884 RepID=A0A914PFI4_9BILA
MFAVPNRDIPILFSFICIIYLSKNYLPEIPKFGKNCQIYHFQRKESSLAHLFLDNLKGIEIGGSLINPFCLNTINVDFTNGTKTGYKKSELRYSKGGYLNVDVVASGDKLPFKNESYDFVISSHAIEHFFDPIKTIEEWFRVIKINGYIFMTIPHKERTFDRLKNRTTLNELLLRHNGTYYDGPDDGHHNIWITEDVMELCRNRNWTVVAWLDKDDVFGNGFTIALQKNKYL